MEVAMAVSALYLRRKLGSEEETAKTLAKFAARVYYVFTFYNDRFIFHTFKG